jgi:nucleoside-diphosphate-sugar epimerase
MRVFVTGATGFIGARLVPELLAAGHSVLGLSRSDASAAALKAAGADVHRGDLQHPETLQSGAAQSDAVIHLAFDHDFSKFAEHGEDERRAIVALGDAIAGTKKPLIVTSGLGLKRATEGRPFTEDDEPPGSRESPRTPEIAAAAVAQRGVPVQIIRVPQVHDSRKAGLVTFLIAIAREKGFVAYVGEGTHRWPAAHVSDVARLYPLALAAPQAFARYHAVAEEGVALREIAAVVGKGLKMPVRSITRDEAPAYFGTIARHAVRDLSASSAKTRHMLPWVPTGPGLLADLERLAWV